MSTITRIVKRPTGRKSVTGKPVVIKWQGVPMLRSQSINACVNEILEASKNLSFLKINVIGASGSGKTTLSNVLAHQLHTKSEIPYEVHFFRDEQLINFKETVKGLSSNNQILVFDDLSGLIANYGKKALDKLKAEITTIRHIDDQEDRKIIMMLNFHAQKSLDKFLRISNMTFYTECHLEEIGYLQDLLGKHQTLKIRTFQKLRSEATLYHRFTFNFKTKGEKFVYKEGNPFRLLLYNNGLTTRFVVSPQVEWILGEENICQTCTPEKQNTNSKLNLEDFVNDFSKKFGKGIAKRAIELKLERMGIDVLPKRVGQASIYIEQFFAKKGINLEELAESYNITPNKTKTRLRSKRQPEFRESKIG